MAESAPAYNIEEVKKVFTEAYPKLPYNKKASLRENFLELKEHLEKGELLAAQKPDAEIRKLLNGTEAGTQFNKISDTARTAGLSMNFDDFRGVFNTVEKIVNVRPKGTLYDFAYALKNKDFNTAAEIIETGDFDINEEINGITASEFLRNAADKLSIDQLNSLNEKIEETKQGQQLLTATKAGQVVTPYLSYKNTKNEDTRIDLERTYFYKPSGKNALPAYIAVAAGNKDALGKILADDPSIINTMDIDGDVAADAANTFDMAKHVYGLGGLVTTFSLQRKAADPDQNISLEDKQSALELRKVIDAQLKAQDKSWPGLNFEKYAKIAAAEPPSPQEEPITKSAPVAADVALPPIGLPEFEPAEPRVVTSIPQMDTTAKTAVDKGVRIDNAAEKPAVSEKTKEPIKHADSSPISKTPVAKHTSPKDSPKRVVRQEPINIGDSGANVEKLRESMKELGLKTSPKGQAFSKTEFNAIANEYKGAVTFTKGQSFPCVNADLIHRGADLARDGDAVKRGNAIAAELTKHINPENKEAVAKATKLHQEREKYTRDIDSQTKAVTKELRGNTHSAGADLIRKIDGNGILNIADGKVLEREVETFLKNKSPKERTAILKQLDEMGFKPSEMNGRDRIAREERESKTLLAKKEGTDHSPLSKKQQKLLDHYEVDTNKDGKYTAKEIKKAVKDNPELGWKLSASGVKSSGQEYNGSTKAPHTAKDVKLAAKSEIHH